MATATQSADEQLGRADSKAGSSPQMGPPTFEVYEENSGRHRWQLTSSDGTNLATSCVSFASHDDAERAAGHVRASSAG